MSISESETYGRYWREQIEQAGEASKPWEGRGDKVVRRYRDERDDVEAGRSKFNILWSNVQVLGPSLYGRPPKPEVSRRYMDSDPVGRLSSTMLERTLLYEVTQFPDFDQSMQSCVEDRLLPGRATAFVRLDKDIDVATVDKSYSPIQYVYWKDFRHSPARTWEEVDWIAFRSYLTKEKVVERFGDKFADVPVEYHKQDNATAKDDKSEKSKTEQKAAIWEIWNKKNRKVCWIAEGYPLLLDEKPDPLQLEGFWPCPEPLYATTTNGSLTPVPDYCQYQDQAEEIDTLTARIDELSEAVRVAGVYNAEHKELARLFQTKGNRLIGVANWAALAEKQGLKGQIDLIDLQPIAQALSILTNLREGLKQGIYEICGISDILRGSTKAEETLGAQQLKANFGSLRLRSSQVDVARFATDLFRLKAQIICKFYPQGLIEQMSAIAKTDDGKDPALIAEAFKLLSNSTIRDFHIEVESDTLAQIDEAREKEEATQAVMAIGGFIKEAVPMVQAAPSTLPVAKSMLLFIARKSKGGRELEAAIEQSMTALEKEAKAAAANPQPSPEERKAMIEAQTQAQADQLRAATETQAHQLKTQADQQTQASKLQWEMQLETMKSQQEKQLAQLEGQVKMALASMEDETKRYIAGLQSQTQIAVAQIGAASQANVAEKGIEGEKIKATPKPDPKLPGVIAKVDALIEQSQKPSRIKVIRDGAGRMAEIEKDGKRKKVVRDKDDKITELTDTVQ